MVVPQLGPRARRLAVLPLQLAAERRRREDEVVADAELLEVGEQVEQEVDRDRAQRLARTWLHINMRVPMCCLARGGGTVRWRGGDSAAGGRVGGISGRAPGP